MLVENSYPQDTRVRNEATLLVSEGYDVSVVSLRSEGQKSFEIVDGVRAYRVPRVELFKKTAGKQPGLLGMLWLKAKALMGYTVEYVYFSSACFVVTLSVFLRRGFDVIHAHNPPDTLFLVALPFKLLGKKFVFDHHDLSPELYMSRYGAQPGMLTRMLGLAEWCSLKLADITIATNESYKSVQIERANKDPETIFIVRNGPSQTRMTPPAASPKLRAMNKCVLCYIGSLNPQDGVDYLLRSLGHLVHTLKRDDFYCVIMGAGDSLEDLRALSKELQLDRIVNLTGFVSEDELQANLAAADICLDPDPASPLNNVSTWIKIMEYMAFAKPIVSFDLKETRVSAADAALFVPVNDEVAFAKAIIELMDDPLRCKKMGEAGRKRVEEKLQWAIVGQNLVDAYRTLLRA
jgi:glycosyltransferase involved in cell wall biosynthesis